MEIWTPEFAQAHRKLAQLAEEGKVRLTFLLFSFTRRSGRHSLRRRIGNWPGSQRRERYLRRSFCCSPLREDLDARVCAGAKATVPARRGGKGKTSFFADHLYAEIWTPEFAQAHRQLAQLAVKGKVRRSFLLFSSVWRSGRQSLRRRTGNWPRSQRRERYDVLFLLFF